MVGLYFNGFICLLVVYVLGHHSGQGLVNLAIHLLATLLGPCVVVDVAAAAVTHDDDSSYRSTVAS